MMIMRMNVAIFGDDHEHDEDDLCIFTMMMTIKTTCSPDGSVAPGITAGSLQMLLIKIKVINIKMTMIIDQDDHYCITGKWIGNMLRAI